MPLGLFITTELTFWQGNTLFLTPREPVSGLGDTLSTLNDQPLGLMGSSKAPRAAPVTACWQFLSQPTSTRTPLQPQGLSVLLSHPPADLDCAGAGEPSLLSNPRVTRGTTPVTAVSGPQVDTSVLWEHGIRVWALLPWLERPMTPQFIMQ